MKKILLSLIAIGLVVSLVSGGIFAYFQDTEVSAGNTFTAGTLDLGLDIDTITVKLHPNSVNDATICQGWAECSFHLKIERSLPQAMILG